jgi:hypothetical protein
MERLLIEATKSTPTVDFNAGRKQLTIRGESYPENSFQFYDPILQWLDSFLKQASPEGPIVMDLQLSYINTSSSKCLMMILEKLEEAKTSGHCVSVNWYYDPENENELECAEEFRDFVELTEFNIIPLFKQV